MDCGRWGNGGWLSNFHKGAELGTLLRAMLGRLRTYVALFGARRSTQQNLAKPACRVLVVCYGNIYRSAFLGGYLAQRAQSRLEVRSTGFHQRIGRSSPERHIAMSREFGVDLSQHRSARIQMSDIDWADIVVIMDRHNWQALSRLNPPRDKVVWAGALTAGEVEIRDPYEMTDQAAKHAIERLRDAGDRLIERLVLQR